MSSDFSKKRTWKENAPFRLKRMNPFCINFKGNARFPADPSPPFAGGNALLHFYRASAASKQSLSGISG
jgi:hypothetical protein